MVEGDQHLKETFPLPPLVAYKRLPNIKDKLIRSKVPKSTNQRPRRLVPGMSRCNNCATCPFVQTGKTVRATATNQTVEINRPVTCQTKNIIYCVFCDKCAVQYVGESERTLNLRFSEHKGYAVNRKLQKVTGAHFNEKGHKVSDMRVTILEKVFSTDENVRKEREHHYINIMNTKYKGLNKKT